MLVKFNNYSHNIKGRLTVLQYLLDSLRVEQGTAYVLSGDQSFTKHLIEGNKRKHQYVSGGLMLHMNDKLTVEQEREIMSEFEKMVFVGLDKSQYHILWIKHVDKEGRVELNFVIPRQELSRGIDLDVYSHKRDKPIFNMWKNGVNKKYQLADPNAESRKRTQEERMEMKMHRTKKGDFENSFIFKRGNLDAYLQEQVSTGVLQSKDEIIKYLKSEGFEITRNTKNSLSVKGESLGKRALRLQARPIYQDSFKSLADFPQIEAAKAIDEPIKFDDSIYSKYLKRRSDRHLKRYCQKKKTATADLSPSKKLVQPIALEEKEDYDTRREVAPGSKSRDSEERQDNRGTENSVQKGAEELVGECFSVHQGRDTKPIKAYSERFRRGLKIVSREIEEFTRREQKVKEEEKKNDRIRRTISELDARNAERKRGREERKRGREERITYLSNENEQDTSRDFDGIAKANPERQRARRDLILIEAVADNLSKFLNTLNTVIGVIGKIEEAITTIVKQPKRVPLSPENIHLKKEISENLEVLKEWKNEGMGYILHEELNSYLQLGKMKNVLTPDEKNMIKMFGDYYKNSHEKPSEISEDRVKNILEMDSKKLEKELFIKLREDRKMEVKKPTEAKPKEFDLGKLMGMGKVKSPKHPS